MNKASVGGIYPVHTASQTLDTMLRRFLPLFCLLLLCFSAVACDSTDDRPEVTIVDLVLGDGEEVQDGSRIAVHYVGKFPNGRVFDSSLAEFNDRLEVDRPFMFTLGRNSVISGWEQGIPGMRVGGTRQLLIPPELGYGSRGAGCPNPGQDGECVVPPDATLIFDVELLSVQTQ